MAEIQRRQAIPAQFGNSHFAKAFARIRIAPHVKGLVRVSGEYGAIRAGGMDP
jgi:hypothetical protein